ncbi:MAG: COX15/CtaA family protein [Gammaproteobacteria bacterium]
MGNKTVRRLLQCAAPLAFFVIAAGAYTRLSDAGLGCPDWPGCYGQVVGVPSAAAAAAHSPHAPLDARKARIELGHRYVAGVLGLILFAAAGLSWRQTPRPRAPLFLAALVIAQALLGMLTVTQGLRPIIVVAHLLGGALILAALAFTLTARPLPRAPPRLLRVLAAAAAAALAVQIFLGGWVSANYAALSCPDFPLCRGGWLPPQTDWSGFAPGRELYLDATGAAVSDAALATIHWTHRAFAPVALILLFAFGAVLWREKARGAAVLLWILPAAQAVLGAVNVLAGLPIWSALAHNAVAVLIAATIGMMFAKINLSGAPRPSRP